MKISQSGSFQERRNIIKQSSAMVLFFPRFGVGGVLMSSRILAIDANDCSSIAM
jgi:hypothetical protein